MTNVHVCHFPSEGVLWPSIPQNISNNGITCTAFVKNWCVTQG